MGIVKRLVCFWGVILSFAPSASQAQAYRAGTFRLDGIPVVCGLVTTIEANINDSAMADLKGHIYVNPAVLSQFPTVIKLWTFAHECGHYMVGTNESRADCWAIRTGKAQGWFTDQNFSELEDVFRNNPGDLHHKPGPVRVDEMRTCFGLPKTEERKSTVDRSVPDRKTEPKSRPSADKDRAVNAFVDAIVDLPIQETRPNGELRWTSQHTIALKGECVLEANTRHKTIRDGSTWVITQVIPLANLTVDVAKYNGDSQLVFHSTNRGMQSARSDINGNKPESTDRTSFAITTTDDARRLRDLAQSAIRACSE